MRILRRKIENARASYRALYIFLKEGTSFQGYAIAAAMTIFFSFMFRITETEFLIVLLTIGIVLSVEALNTAIEEVCNHVTPHHHPQIGKIKDLASGASGIMGIAALIIGIIIFMPHFIVLL